MIENSVISTAYMFGMQCILMIVKFCFANSLTFYSDDHMFQPSNSSETINFQTTQIVLNVQQ